MKAPSNGKLLGLKSNTIGKSGLHRGRKKRQEARLRVEKKQKFIEEEISKAEKRKPSKKVLALGPALAVLDSLADALPDEVETKKKDDATTKSVTKHWQRRKLVREETEQVRNVREHEAFKKNGIEALRLHLLNTVSRNPNEIAPALQPGQPGAPKKRKTENVKEKGKSAKKGGLSLPDKKDMEQVREAARDRVAKKRAKKEEWGRAAEQLKKKKQGGKIEKQTMRSLLGKRRGGRIGEKRPKI